MPELLKDLLPLFLFILGYVVIVVITILLVQVCYNHSIVTLTEDPITKKPRLQQMQFLQAFALVVLLRLLFPRDILPYLTKRQQIKSP